jgi:long-chain fatty acid transport protein
VCVVCVSAGVSRAADEPRSFELTFSSPGARSMGLAGAFVPLADDATAAFANPAGLVQLLSPELSVEGRLRGTVEDGQDGQTTFGSVSGLSFFSAVYPLQRWSFALYGHQLASLDFKTAGQTGSAGLGRTWAAPAGTETLKELAVSRLGLSVAYRLREGLSLGIGFSRFDGTLKLTGQGATGAQRSEESTSWAWNAGVLWSVSEQLRLGGFYRQGPTLAIGNAGESAAKASSTAHQAELKLPDSHGLGLAFRSHDEALSLAFEWDRVRYSALRAGMSSLAGGDPGVSVGDVDELHLGAEYAFLKVNPVLAARAGVWLEPDHRVCSTTPGSPYVCAAGSRDEVHATLGFGMAFRRFQLDVGLDRSRSLAAFSISGILSF